MDLWGDRHIDFLGKRKPTFTVSIILAIIGLVAVGAIGMGRANLGTDFSGGIAIQYRFEEPLKIEEVRGLLSEGGFGDAQLQQFSEPNKMLVRLKNAEGNLQATSKALDSIFTSGLAGNPFIIDSTTEVGPTVGKKLQTDALKAIGVALLGILFYVAWRFEFRFGIAAVIATFHDVLIVLGILFMLDKEITLLIVTGLLTLAGYSINDSVVVFDRIRENLRRENRKKESNYDLINRSVNEVLRRTVVTSLTTLMALASLLIFGGEVLYDFAFTLFIGVLVGTYSSIFIASPVLLFWDREDKKGAKDGSKGAPAGKAIKPTT
ncbi:MAG: protein translocase subunit SecF [Proteobacteria bacterium]|nr:protein translocase subunit SecF [Pseudomonadota bacterium]